MDENFLWNPATKIAQNTSTFLAKKAEGQAKYIIDDDVHKDWMVV